jgi:hypothetical protein
MKTAYVGLCAAALLVSGLQAKADTIFTATLTGAADGATTSATGYATVDVNSSLTQISYTLTFQNLTSPATMSHIHFGAPGVNGPILLWLFPPTLTSTPSGTSGNYSGTWTQANLVSQSQDSGITTFATLLADMQAGDTYVNIHSLNYPMGELRGQLMMVPEPGALVLTGAFLVLLAAGAAAKRRLAIRD